MIGPRTPVVKANAPIAFRFRALPSEVMASRTLGSTAKLVFAAIADAARGTRSGLCKVANATLADRVGRSESEVGRCLLELEAAGLVRRVFGPSKHVRVGVEVTWSEEVPQERVPVQASVPQLRGTSFPACGDGVPHVPGPGRTASLEPPQNGGALVSGEEKSKISPPLSPEEIRRAIAEGVAGAHASMIFDDATTASTSPAKGIHETNTPSVKPITAKPSTPARGPHGGLDLRRVGVSAVAAAFSPAFGAVRNTPEAVQYQAANWRKLRANLPPAPRLEDPPPRGERLPGQRNPGIFGQIAKPGKMDGR